MNGRLRQGGLVAATLVAGGLSLFTATALGGFTASVVPGTAAGSGTLIATGNANASSCQSSVNNIGSNTEQCAGELLPNGAIPPAATTNPIGLVQTAANANTTGKQLNSLSLVLTTPTIAGHLLVLAVVVNVNSALTISDSAGNVWSAAVSPVFDSGAGEESAIYYVDNASSVSSITMSLATSANHPAMYLYELAGAATSGVLDATGGAAPVASSPISVATTTATTSTNDFAVVAVGTQGPETLTGAVWTVNTTYGGHPVDATVGNQSVPTMGVVTFSDTAVNTLFSGAVATFRPVSVSQPPLTGTSNIGNVGTASGVGTVSGGTCGAWGANDATGGGESWCGLRWSCHWIWTIWWQWQSDV